MGDRYVYICTDMDLYNKVVRRKRLTIFGLGIDIRPCPPYTISKPIGEMR